MNCLTGKIVSETTLVGKVGENSDISSIVCRQAIVTSFIARSPVIPIQGPPGVAGADGLPVAFTANGTRTNPIEISSNVTLTLLGAPRERIYLKSMGGNKVVTLPAPGVIGIKELVITVVGLLGTIQIDDSMGTQTSGPKWTGKNKSQIAFLSDDTDSWLEDRRNEI